MKYIKLFQTFSELPFNDMEIFKECLEPFIELGTLNESDFEDEEILNEDELILEVAVSTFIVGIMAMPKILMLVGSVANLIKKKINPNSTPSSVAKWLVTKGFAMQGLYLKGIKFILRLFKKKMFIDPTTGKLDEVKLDKYAKSVFIAILATAAITSGMTSLDAIGKVAGMKVVSKGLTKGAVDVISDELDMDEILDGLEQLGEVI